MFPATVARHTNKDAFKHLGYSNAKRKLGVMDFGATPPT